MIIDLRTISEGSRRFQFVLEQDWWPSEAQRDQILGIGAPVQVNLEIYKAGDKYVLDGELRGGLQVVCDRCLEAYHRELRTTFRLYLALPLPEEDDTEIELAEKDLEVDFIRGEEIELDEIIREQMYLSLPMKSLCSENCLGLCPSCGSNLNAGNCQCHREPGHPAFLKLKNLKIEGEYTRDMAVPRKKKSRSRRDMRRSHDHVKMPNISLCPQCHEPALPHHVCPHCGAYRGKTIVKIEKT